jgi:hypothetical protein
MLSDLSDSVFTLGDIFEVADEEEENDRCEWLRFIKSQSAAVMVAVFGSTSKMGVAFGCRCPPFLRSPPHLLRVLRISREHGSRCWDPERGVM